MKILTHERHVTGFSIYKNMCEIKSPLRTYLFSLFGTGDIAYMDSKGVAHYKMREWVVSGGE